jgi:hypothetical protein
MENYSDLIFHPKLRDIEPETAVMDTFVQIISVDV